MLFFFNDYNDDLFFFNTNVCCRHKTWLTRSLLSPCKQKKSVTYCSQKSISCDGHGHFFGCGGRVIHGVAKLLQKELRTKIWQQTHYMLLLLHNMSLPEITFLSVEYISYSILFHEEMTLIKTLNQLPLNLPAVLCMHTYNLQWNTIYTQREIFWMPAYIQSSVKHNLYWERSFLLTL